MKVDISSIVNELNSIADSLEIYGRYDQESPSLFAYVTKLERIKIITTITW